MVAQSSACRRWHGPVAWRLVVGVRSVQFSALPSHLSRECTARRATSGALSHETIPASRPFVGELYRISPCGVPPAHGVSMCRRCYVSCIRRLGECVCVRVVFSLRWPLPASPSRSYLGGGGQIRKSIGQISSEFDQGWTGLHQHRSNLVKCCSAVAGFDLN